MTEENKALAYQLWLQHWSYADIAAHLEAKQGDVIRAVAAAQRKQDALCSRCSWRKDGLEICQPPVCLDKNKGGMDVRVQELIQRLRTESLRADRCTTQIMDLCMEAAEVLECVFSGDDEEINLCVCCTHIEHMEQCKMDVGCSRCGETGCPCQNCHGGSNWQRKNKEEN